MARSKKPRHLAPIDRVSLALDTPAWLSTVLPDLLRGEVVLDDSADAMDVRQAFAKEFERWDRQRRGTLDLVRTLLARRDDETRTAPERGGPQMLRTWNVTRDDKDLEELIVEMRGKREGDADSWHLYEQPENNAILSALCDEGWGVIYPAPLRLLTINEQTYGIPSGIIVMMGRPKGARR